MLLASFGPVFVILPSPVSSFIDYVAVLLLPVVVCWNWPLPVVVEGEEQGGTFRNQHANQHGSCDLLSAGSNVLENIKFLRHSSPPSTNHMIMWQLDEHYWLELTPMCWSFGAKDQSRVKNTGDEKAGEDEMGLETYICINVFANEKIQPPTP